jgi:hypothetical protein
MNNIKDFEEQQLNNYIYAVCDIVSNNTNNLVDSDIKFLIEKPPLDSMDVIKNKLLDVAKKNKLLIDTEFVNKTLSKYRDSLIKDLDFIKKYRINEISSDVKNFKPVKNLDIIKITKKRLNEIDKKIVTDSKKVIKDDVSKYLIKNMDKFFMIKDKDIDSKFLKDLEKFFNKDYQKSVIEGIELKLIVKDTTLINGAKEQAERYLFTKANSRLNDLD